MSDLTIALIGLLMLIASFVMLIMITERLGRIRKESIDTTEALVQCWKQLEGIRVQLGGTPGNAKPSSKPPSVT